MTNDRKATICIVAGAITTGFGSVVVANGGNRICDGLGTALQGMVLFVFGCALLFLCPWLINKD